MFGQSTFSATGLPIAIPDATGSGCTDPEGIVSNSIVVSGLPGTVASNDEVQVSVDIAHVWGGDIVVGITPPGGTEIIVINRVGGCTNGNDWTTGNVINIRQNAGGSLPTNFAAGTYLPTAGTVPGNPFTLGSLASLVGATRNGTWTLRVMDGAGIDAGTLNAASITFFPAAVLSPSPAGIFCAGSSKTLSFSVGNSSFNAGNTFSVELSDAAGSFAAPTTIGSVAGTTSGSMSVTIPGGTPVGMGYRMRILGSDPSYTSPDNGTNLEVVAGQPAQASISASVNTVCVGMPVTLMATPAMGFMGVEYLWYKAGVAVNSGNSSTYTVSNSTAGTDDYSVEIAYTTYNCLSVQSAVTTITKVALPNATITPSGPTTFCANMPTSLSVLTGETTYQWKRSAMPVGTNSNTYTPTVSGNHAVIVTNSSGCTKTSPWMVITIKALPVANAGIDKILCTGSSVQIGSPNNAGNTYLWSPSTGLSNTTVANPISSATSTITYTVTVTNTATTCTNTDQVMVNSLSLPAMPSIAVSGTGNTRLLTSTTPGASTINWLRNGAAFGQNGKLPNSTLTVPVSNPTKAYTVVSKDANGCLSMPSAPSNVRVGDGKGGDVILTENIMQAYPNPTTGILQVAINNSGVEIAKLVLYNTLGQVVLEKEISLFAGNAQVEFDMSALAVGVYSLSFQTETENYVTKIVKE